jgi:hypothetical protein
MVMELNLNAVIAATVVMFGIGAFWYMPLFGKLWGKIHDFDKLSKEKQKEMQSKMGPWYAAQLIVIIMQAFALTHFITAMPDVEYWKIAFWLWLGFVVPTETSAMIFGGSKPEYIWHKIFITIGEALLHMLVAAWVINMMIK